MIPLSKAAALSRAMKLCAGKEYCIRDVHTKLQSWKVDESWISDIIQQLVKDKFIDESRYARAFAKDKLRFNHWGAVKIRYQLKMKGISESVIAAAFEDLEEINQEEIIRKELEMKRKQLKDEDPYRIKMKLLRFAQGRGYDLDLVMQILGDN